MLKTVELLYLLCSRNNRLLPAAGPPEGDGMLRTIAGVRAYMEAHLGDKMTIAGLSRRFCLSQTALKTGFRHAYGMPLHRWLLTQRMRRAGELLRAPAGRRDMLRIAQAVGYDGRQPVLPRLQAVLRRHARAICKNARNRKRRTGL